MVRASTGLNGVQGVPRSSLPSTSSLDRRISTVSELAWKLSVTRRFEVRAAPPLIATLPVGGKGSACGVAVSTGVSALASGEEGWPAIRR